MIARLAEFLQLKPNVVWTLAGVFFALLVGSAIRAISIPFLPRERRHQRIASLRTWWILGFLFSVAVLLGRASAVLFFAAASYLGIREFLELALPNRQERRELNFVPYVVLVHYACVYAGEFTLVWLLVPLGCVLFVPIRLVSADRPEGFTRRVAVTYLGLMLTVFCLSHAPLLLSLPATANPIGGPAGWLLYLVLLTEICDISQALWGRALGRHKITPTVSPHKTWEGFVGGIATTTLLAVLAAMWLTPWASERPASDLSAVWSRSFVPAVVAGLLIPVSGFFGDITMSALKRDAGVKDSSSMLPGQGGVLDRIDSLMFSAPVFFYYVFWLYR